MPTLDESIIGISTDPSFVTIGPTLPIPLSPVAQIGNLNYFERLPLWAVDTNLSLTSVPRTGKIAGVTKVGGVMTPHLRVSLYYKPTGALIASIFSDENGAYSFPTLDPSKAQYFLVGFDAPYNAVAFDRLTPVPE